MTQQPLLLGVYPEKAIVGVLAVFAVAKTSESFKCHRLADKEDVIHTQ